MARGACYPVWVVPRRLSSLIFACLAVVVYAVAVAAPGAGVVPAQAPTGAGAVQRAALDHPYHAGTPHPGAARHAPRSDEQAARQRDTRTGAGASPLTLPLAVLAAAWLAGSSPADPGRSFTVVDTQPWVHGGFVSTRTSHRPPATRS